MILIIHKAVSLNEVETPNLSIQATNEFPSSVSLDANFQMDLFRGEAKQLADALYGTLPGGTLDQLLREMLERKASQFIVRF